MSFLRNIRALAALTFSLALSSLPVLAEEAEEGSGGMPQLDPSFYAEQIFWLVVTFGTLYLLMSFVALPRVDRTQSNRKRVIATEIKAAREANDSAKATAAAMDKSLAEARGRAQASVSEMLAHVVQESNEHQTAKEKELSRKLHRAEEDIAVSREAAMQEVRDRAADLAKSVVHKILGSQRRAKA